MCVVFLQGWFFLKVTVEVTRRCWPGQVHHQFWGRKRRGGGVWCRSGPVTPPYRCQIWSLLGQWLALWHIQASAMVGVLVSLLPSPYSSVTALSSSPHQIQPLGTGLGRSKLTWSGVVLGSDQRHKDVPRQNLSFLLAFFLSSFSLSLSLPLCLSVSLNQRQTRWHNLIDVVYTHFLPDSSGTWEPAWDRPLERNRLSQSAFCPIGTGQNDNLENLKQF